MTAWQAGSRGELVKLLIQFNLRQRRLLNLQLRAIETTEVERRLEEWGKQSEADQTNTELKQRQNEVPQANESTERAKPLNDMATDTAWHPSK